MRTPVLVRAAGFLLWALCSAAAWPGANEDEVLRVASQITEICRTQGMLACEKNFRNADELFEFLHEFDKLANTEAGFAKFVEERYPGQKFDWSLMEASLKLKLDLEVTPNKFVENMKSAEKIADGYHVTNGKGQEFDLRHDAAGWYVEPDAAAREEMKKGLQQLSPYFFAAHTKRRILLYRALEADMAKLDLATLQANVGADLAPIVAAMLGPDKVPEAMRGKLKSLDEVAQFYRPLDTRGKMEDSIRTAHGLAPTVQSSL